MSDRIRADAEAPDEPPRTPTETPPEPQERPGEEPRPQQREEPSAPPAAPDEAVESSEAQGEPSAEEQQRVVQQRIDRLTREKFEAQRQRDQVLAEFERARQQASQAQRPALPPGQEDPYERARREVRDEQIANEFNRQCNTLYQKGQQEYGAEMDDAVSALNAVGWGNRPDALAAVTQLPDGHRVYRELAKNLDNAARVLSLPPMAMAMELARLSHGEAAANGAGNGAAVPVSRAPEPHRPVGGTSRAAERPLDDNRLSMAEFIRRRDRDERRSRISR